MLNESRRISILCYGTLRARSDHAHANRHYESHILALEKVRARREVVSGSSDYVTHLSIDKYAMGHEG